MNDSKIKVRPCEAHDIAAITEIYAYHVLHSLATFELEPPAKEEMARRRNNILQPGYPYLVAERDGELVGYAYVGPYRPRPAYRHTVENSIYVHPGHLREGIGQVLLQALLAECQARGFRQMIAVIGDSSHQASIGLHERFGFRLVGVLHSVGFKFGRWVDTVLMQRELGEEALSANPPPKPLP
jgi:phosphinothricin acetyltransferase